MCLSKQLEDFLAAPDSPAEPEMGDLAVPLAQPQKDLLVSVLARAEGDRVVTASAVARL